MLRLSLASIVGLKAPSPSMMNDNVAKRQVHARRLICSIYAAVRELKELFPGRQFTPDGIKVGELGEVLAEIEYNIRLLPPCTASHDAVVAGSSRRVQIRTNQRDAAYLREEPDLLLALKLLPDGNIETVYNGPGKPAWKLAQEVKPDRAGYRAIRHSKLRALGAQKTRIPKRVSATRIDCKALSPFPPPCPNGLTSEL